MKRIIGAAGHSLTISGAVYGDERESESAIVITDNFLRTLDAKGFKTALVPHALDYVPTVKWINDRQWPSETLALEFHKNAGNPDADGIEVYYEAGNVPMQVEATMLAAAIARHTGLPNRLARPDTSTRFGLKGLYFCRGPKVPSLLVEMGQIGAVHNEKQLGIDAGMAVVELYGPAKGDEDLSHALIVQKSSRGFQILGGDNSQGGHVKVMCRKADGPATEVRVHLHRHGRASEEVNKELIRDTQPRIFTVGTDKVSGDFALQVTQNDGDGPVELFVGAVQHS